MAEKVLIMGESGTGKSTSIRNCDPNTTAIVNPVGKPLPFKGSRHFNTLNGETDANEICDFIRIQVYDKNKKMIIIDDFQYILAIPFMNRIKESGWDKYNDFGANYFKIIDICRELPDDVIIYYLTHCETLESGLTTVKLIGKLLREKITIEGLFTIVLKTGVNEGKYYFFTQNNGKDTVKSPIGMFDAFSIDNDLAYVDAKVRNFYEMSGAKSDAEMAKLDTEKAGEVEAPAPRGRRRLATSETSSEESRKSRSDIAKEKAEEEITLREMGFEKVANGREEVPFDEVTKATEEIKAEIQNSESTNNVPVRRTRKKREE